MVNVDSKEKRTLSSNNRNRSSRVLSRVIRLFPLTSFTPPALRRIHERGNRIGVRFDSQIGTQRSDELVFNLTTANFGILFRSRICGLFGGTRICLSDVDANLRIEKLEGSLDDNALEELHVL